MTRRPYMPHAQKVSRASHLLTAPGKKWSESPTPRVGPDRPPRQAATPPVPIAPTFIDRDQWIEYNVTSFEINDWAGPWETHYSPAFGTFDKAWCWHYTYTPTTFTPPSGWTTLWSGTHDGVQFWLGWVDNAGADTDWTITYNQAPGYPEGYRTVHTVCEYFNGGNMVPHVQSQDLVSNVTTRPTPDYDTSWAFPRQFSAQFGCTKMYADWDDTWYSYHYTAFFSTTCPGWQSRDFWERDGGLRNANGITRFWADSARTTPLSLPTLIQFAIGWAM